MLIYLTEALHKFQHPTTPRQHNSPHAWKNKVYGTAVQEDVIPNDSQRLPPKAINHVQKIIGTLQYFAIAVDPTMLISLGSIDAQ